MRTILPLLLLFCSPSLFAQGSSDDNRFHQFSVSDGPAPGTYSLTPRWYYQLLHDSYSNTAVLTNKTTHRALIASQYVHPQVETADSMEADIKKRAVIEVETWGSRLSGDPDVSWPTYKDRINKHLASLQALISRLPTYGGTYDDLHLWNLNYKKFTCGIKAIQDAYLDNSKRAEAYGSLLKDIVAAEHEVLILCRQRAVCQRAVLDAQNFRSAPAALSPVNAAVSRAFTAWRDNIYLSLHH